MDFSHSLTHSFFRRCLTNCSSRRQLFTVLGRLSIWNFEKLYYWKADVLLDFSMFSFLWVLVILKLRRKKVCIIITDVLLTVVAGEKCINSVLLAYMQQTSLMRCMIQFYFLVISLNRHLVPCGFQCFTHLVPCGFQCFTHCNVTLTNWCELSWKFETVTALCLVVFQLSLTDEHKKLPSGTYQVRVFDEEGYAWLRKVKRQWTWALFVSFGICKWLFWYTILKSVSVHLYVMCLCWLCSVVQHVQTSALGGLLSVIKDLKRWRCMTSCL